MATAGERHSSGADYVLARFREKRRLLEPTAETAKAIERIRGGWGDKLPVVSETELRELNQFADQELSFRLRDIVWIAKELLGKDVTVQFGYLPVQDMKAFSGRTSNGDWVIFLDGFLERFLFGLCVNRALRIYGGLDRDEVKALCSIGIDLLETFFAPHTHFIYQDNMDWVFARDRDVSMIGLNVSRAILCFILSHELSHLLLDHGPSCRGREAELDADRQAFEIFLQLVEKGNKLEWAGVPSLYDCSPLIYFEIRGLLDLFQQLRQREVRAPGGSHPVPTERREQLLKAGQGRFCPEGLDLYEAYKGCLEELGSVLSAEFTGSSNNKMQF